MNKVNVGIPQEVKDLVQEVSDNEPDFDTYLSGGALRDYYCGLEPKDIDIMLVPKDGKEKEVKYTPLRTIINYRLSAIDISDMEERGVFQLIGMKNYTIETSEVQYIVYGKYLTQEQVTLDMDMSIAQITWAAGDDFCLVSDAFLDDHSNKVIRCLHEYDEGRMYDRYCRMEAKFPDYTVIGKPEIDTEAIGASSGVGFTLKGTGALVEGKPSVKRAGGDY